MRTTGVVLIVSGIVLIVSAFVLVFAIVASGFLGFFGLMFMLQDVWLLTPVFLVAGIALVVLGARRRGPPDATR